MILVQIATALAIGAYVVLSKEPQHERLDATPREPLRLQHPADNLLDRAGRPEPFAGASSPAHRLICRQHHIARQAELIIAGNRKL
jgi:hypothetical protein